MSINEGHKTFTSGEALAAKRRVKIQSGTTTNPPEVVYADAGEQHIGVTEYAVATATLVSVRLRTSGGTQEATAAGAFSVGATLYGAADGKIDDASSGTAIGIALEAATADGDQVEFDDFTVISTAASGISYADANGLSATTTAEAALQEIHQHILSAQSFAPVPLQTLMESDATNTVDYLGTGTTPTLDLANGDTDSGLVVTWAASNSDAVIFQLPLPPKIDVASDIVIHLRAKSGGATDTPVIDADSYFNEGDTKVSDASPALTASYAEHVITIAAADVPAGAQTLTVELTPAAHTTDTVVVSAIWVEFTSVILTS